MKLFDNAFWNAIITAIISAIITNLCLWWHKKTDYKRDYYKKIIDKRMNAYEKIAEAITKVGTKSVYVINGEKKEIFICFESFTKLDEVNKLLISAIKELHWISPKTNKALWKLNNIIAEVLDEASVDSSKKKKWTDDDFKKKGIELHKKLRNALSEVNISSINDRMCLDDVKGFFKEQKEQMSK